MTKTLMRSILLTLLVAAALPLAGHAQSYTISPSPFLTALDNSGRIINNACIWTYSAGTSTAATTYSDTSGTQNSNPIRSDSAGRFTAYLIAGNNYKFVYESACTPPAHGTTLRTADNIAATPASSASVDITGTAGENLTANQAVYLSDGSGSKTAGQWFRTDSTNTYSSTLPVTGFALTSVSTAASVSIRLSGPITGLGSLTIGADYYVSGSAGGITATAPANSRFIGRADTATSLIAVANPRPPTRVDNSLVSGRLSLSSGSCGSASDVTGAATVYYTPCNGNLIALYDGSAWRHVTYAETSLALGTLTSTLPYDVFAYLDNSSAFAVEKLAWTNTTIRATALVKQDGVWSKSGDTTRRFLGTFATVSTTTTEDSLAVRALYNYYNRILHAVRVTEATDTWVYSSATVRQANAASANRVQIMVGSPTGEHEDALDLTLYAASSQAEGPTKRFRWNAIGEDSTTTMASGCLTFRFAATASGDIQVNLALLTKHPTIGFHAYNWLEAAEGAGETDTWYGDNGAPTTSQSGMRGLWRN